MTKLNLLSVFVGAVSVAAIASAADAPTTAKPTTAAAPAVTATTTAKPGTAPTVAPAADKEKCFGVVKAGKNDCASKSPTHSCQGQSTTDGDMNDWVFLPKGICERLVGGMTEDMMKAKPAVIAPAAKPAAAPAVAPAATPATKPAASAEYIKLAAANTKNTGKNAKVNANNQAKTSNENGQAEEGDDQTSYNYNK